MQRKQLIIDYKHHVMAMREFVSRCEAQIQGTSFDTGGEASHSKDLRQSAVTALEAPVENAIRASASELCESLRALTASAVWVSTS